MRVHCNYPNTVVVLPRERVRRFYQPGWHQIDPEDWPFLKMTDHQGDGWRRATWAEAAEGDIALIVRDAGLGDLLRLTPTLREVAQRGVKIILATYAKFMDLFEGNPHVWRQRSFPESTHPSFSEVDTDYTFDLHFAVDGYDDPTTRLESRIDRFGMRVLGHPPADKSLVFVQNAEAQQYADDLLAPLEGKPFVVFSSRSWANWLRGWLPEYYAPTAHLLAQAGYVSVYVGLPGAESENGFYDLRGRTAGSCQQLAGILNRAEALIAPDTGTLHLGEAVGVPTVGLFGNTNPVEVIKHYKHVTPISKNDEVGCQPCLRHQGDCFRCMEKIKPEEVAKTVLSLIGSAA